MGNITVHRRFWDGKCVECGTAFVIDAEGGPACPKCDASDLADALERRAADARELERDLKPDNVRELLARESPASRAAIQAFFPHARELFPAASAIDERTAAAAELGSIQRELSRPAPTPPAAAYRAPAGANFCCGKACPGLPYAASEIAHPPSCLAPGQVVGPNHAALAAELNAAGLGRAFPTERECDALAFCFEVAQRDHGGARRIRQLLYAWHNGAELGGFDLADLWSLDETYRGHALTLIGMVARSPCGWYAEHYGYAADMVALIETYGPAGVRRFETCATCGVRHAHWCDDGRRSTREHES
jgi:hypothetical protein